MPKNKENNKYPDYHNFQGNYNYHAASFNCLLNQKKNQKIINTCKNKNDGTNISWDSTGNDVFTKSCNALLINVYDKVNKDRTLQDLIKDQNWSKDSREIWEARLAQIIDEEREKFPILKTKNESFLENRTLNKMTPSSPFDCEHIHLVQGLIMQEVDNTKLKNGTGYKEPSHYYYMEGKKIHSSDYSAIGHVLIYSSSSNNLINYNEIIKNNNKEYGFKDFLAGKEIYSNSTLTFDSGSPKKLDSIFIIEIFDPAILYVESKQSEKDHLARKYEFEISEIIRDKYKLLFKEEPNNKKYYEKQMFKELVDTFSKGDSQLDGLELLHMSKIMKEAGVKSKFHVRDSGKSTGNIIEFDNDYGEKYSNSQLDLQSIYLDNQKNSKKKERDF